MAVYQTVEDIARNASKHLFTCTIQQLRFGFSRVSVECGDEHEFHRAIRHFSALRGVHTESRFISGSGRLFLMPESDFQKYTKAVEQENKKSDAWWHRYHAADTETRALMACGEIG